jgi:hypothetical protein
LKLTSSTYLVNQASDWGEIVEGRAQEVGDTLLQNGVREASKIVTLEQISSVVNATSEVGNIKTDEGVSRAGVTPKLQGVGVGGVCDSNILEDIRGGILVRCRTTVLVFVSESSQEKAAF